MVNVNKPKPYRTPKARNPFEILLKTIYPTKVQNLFAKNLP
jgi:hypothetical protein